MVRIVFPLITAFFVGLFFYPILLGEFPKWAARLSFSDEQLKITDFIIAIFTIILSIFTGLLFWSTEKLWRATNSALTHSAKQIELARREFLAAFPPKFKFTNDLICYFGVMEDNDNSEYSVKLQFELIVEVINKGNVDGKIFSIDSRIENNTENPSLAGIMEYELSSNVTDFIPDLIGPAEGLYAISCKWNSFVKEDQIFPSETPIGIITFSGTYGDIEGIVRRPFRQSYGLIFDGKEFDARKIKTAPRGKTFHSVDPNGPDADIVRKMTDIINKLDSGELAAEDLNSIDDIFGAANQSPP